MRIRTTGLLILVCIAVVVGCGRNLMPTPNLYHGASVDPFRDVPPSRQSNVVEILYATDRDPPERWGTSFAESEPDGSQLRSGAGI